MLIPPSTTFIRSSRSSASFCSGSSRSGGKPPRVQLYAVWLKHVFMNHSSPGYAVGDSPTPTAFSESGNRGNRIRPGQSRFWFPTDCAGKAESPFVQFWTFPPVGRPHLFPPQEEQTIIGAPKSPLLQATLARLRGILEPAHPSTQIPPLPRDCDPKRLGKWPDELDLERVAGI